MSDPKTKCASCGLPGHRYGRNEGMDRYDPMACINQLRGVLEDLLTNGQRVESDLVALLRERGWVVVHMDDFTIENFHTNPYFRTVVDKVAQWRAHPTDPPTEEE